MRTGFRRAGTERWRGEAAGSQENVIYPRSPDMLTPQPAEPAAAKPPVAGGTAGRGPERNPGSRRAPCRGFGEVRVESPARQNKRRAFRIPRRGTPESVPGAQGGVAKVGGAVGSQADVQNPRSFNVLTPQPAEPAERSGGSPGTGEPAARVPGSRSDLRAGFRERTRAACANRSPESWNGAMARRSGRITRGRSAPAFP